MKAVVYRENRCLVVEEAADPIPRSDEIGMKVTYCAIYGGPPQAESPSSEATSISGLVNHLKPLPSKYRGQSLGRMHGSTGVLP
jgi:hypothetical protein